MAHPSSHAEQTLPEANSASAFPFEHYTMAREQPDTFAPTALSTMGPEYAGIASYIGREIVHPGSLAMRGRMTRNSSVASSVTLCDAIHPSKQKKTVTWGATTKPPVPPFSPVREDNAHKNELFSNDLHQSIEGLSDGLAPPASSKATDFSMRAIKRPRYVNQTSSQGVRKAKAHPAVDSRTDEDDDGSEIMVARKEVPVQDLPNISDSATTVAMDDPKQPKSPSQLGLDHHKLDRTAQEDFNPAPTVATTVKPSPIVLLRRTTDHRAKAIGAKQTLDALDSERETLSDVYKTWGIGTCDKENKPSWEDNVEMADTIAYKGVRHSGRGPKPKRQRDDEVGLKDDEFLHAGETVPGPKKSVRSTKARTSKV